MAAFEVNFDGLVGPTHHYAGLSWGNVASTTHRLHVSNPLAAMLQGLEKMKLLMDLGVKQGVLPPQDRPDFETLRRLGFRGSAAAMLSDSARESPTALAACYSASSMWAANAATVSPSTDTSDGRVHFTPANLVSNFHRSIESRFTGEVLKAIFRDDTAFAHHEPLPAACHFADEGAANHTRLSAAHGHNGIELFVYGRRAFDYNRYGPTTFSPRQTLEASRAIARLHRLDPERTVFARQNPVAIDAGVFHNDVISLGNENVFLSHELAFSDSRVVLEELRRKFYACCGSELVLIEVSEESVPLSDAVKSYLFNSQLVTLPDREMCLIAPSECMEDPRTSSTLDALIAAPNPISLVKFIDVRQSMQNGGGPACLRLRVILTERELAVVHHGVLLTDRLYEELKAWGHKHYRDRLHPEDFADPSLAEEGRVALDELAHLLGLGPIYGFQKSA